MSTKRYCLALDLKDNPELIASYEYYHKSDIIWPEILAGNKEVGIVSMDIYRAGNRLFMIMETVPTFDLQRDFARLGTLPKQQEWAALMLTFQQRLPFASDDTLWVEMQCIFSQN